MNTPESTQANASAGLQCASGDAPKRPPRRLWLLRGVLVGAAIIAAYLYVRTQDVRGLPAGCGPGSPCSTVLASRWAQAAGISVTVPALGLYLTTLLATFVACCDRCGNRAGALARSWLVMAGCLLIGAALWFLGVQGILLHAWCPWCLAEHALGIVAALVIFSVLSRTGPVFGVGPRWGVPVVFAAVSLASLIALQAWGPFEDRQAQRFDSRVTRDSGPGADRVLELAGGTVVISTREFGWLGPHDAPHVLIALSDYSCEHCRKLHRQLEAALRRYPGQLAVLVVPTPLNPDCNPNIHVTLPEHEHACPLAQLALAVAGERPTEFADFDYWLFAPEKTCEPSAALAEAARRMPGVDWETAMRSPRVAAALNMAFDVYRVSNANQIPVLLGKDLQTIVGVQASEEQLFADLELQMGLRPELATDE